MSERHSYAVHPNSMAARKWKRATWTTSDRIFAEIAKAKKAGRHDRAEALRHAAGRARATTHHCG